jgi:hypothetical protein
MDEKCGLVLSCGRVILRKEGLGINDAKNNVNWTVSRVGGSITVRLSSKGGSKVILSH